MTTIAIASKNIVKVRAIEAAFNNFIGDDVISSVCADVPSDVCEQPFDEDVANGAKNRLQHLKEFYHNVDYYVACEGGIVNIYGVYYNVHFVTIEDRHGHTATGISQGYPIPEKYIEEIRKTCLADVLDRIFLGKGGISFLTRGEMNRGSLIKDATTMALTAIMNGEIWSDG